MRWSVLMSLGILTLSSACGSAGPGGTTAPDAPDDPTPTPVGGCDAKKLPTEDPCSISDTVGVFVSRSLGSAGGDGSRKRPYATLSAAIGAAQTHGKRVYACAETYEEAVTLAEGVSVFGYFDCAEAAWTVGSGRATVKSPTSPAGTGRGIAKPTRVEAVELVAPDVSGPSASSIGLLAVDASGLSFVRSRIHGGVAGHGTNGADAVQLASSGSQDGQEGTGFDRCPVNSALCNVGFSTPRYGGTNTCVGKMGIEGGPGGNGGLGGRYFVSNPGLGVYFWAQDNQLPISNGAGGTTSTAAGGTATTFAQLGAAGASGTPGAPGGDVGTFDEARGYVAADGTMGGDGKPGQGGGGGAGNLPPTNQLPLAQNNIGYYFYGRLGGAGGAGGCPGLAAAAGRGGGASIGLVAIRSSLRLESTTVESATGGDGGKAGVPSQPTQGGAGGLAIFQGQAGAPGGAGGAAGISGNGGGGPSIAIAHESGYPLQLGPAVLFVTGTPGKGVGERAESGVVIPASPAGVRSDIVAF